MTSPASEELFAPVGKDVELCYQTFGDPESEPLLLVMGLGGPMTWWDARWCEQLASHGFFVIRYDNRDTGRSTRMTGRVTRGQLLRAYVGLPASAPYSIADMADDAFGLLDHLGIEKAHVVGISMGGMIVQTMTLARPERVLSLASMMSTTGQRAVGWQHPSLLPRLLAPRSNDVEEYVVASVAFGRLIGSPEYPEPQEKARLRAEETWERGLNPAGVMRQMLAVLTQPNRTAELASVTRPALVVHGLADKMVHVSGGRSTSSAIPAAHLLLIDGMGHDLPEGLWQTLVDAIRRNADRASLSR